MKELDIHIANEVSGDEASSVKLFSFLGVELRVLSKRYISDDGHQHQVFGYALFSKITKDGVPLYRKKTRLFKIVRKGRHVWGGTFSRIQTFKRIAE